jgi:hypothetical protein
MAIETNWMWDSVTKMKDVTVTGTGGSAVTSSRNNWVLRRSLITDQEPTSQVDQEEGVLIGYYGNLEMAETIPQPTEAYVAFSANTSWTLTGTPWIQNGQTNMGQPVYKANPVGDNIPNAAKINVCALYKHSGVNHRWIAYESDDGMAHLTTKAVSGSEELFFGVNRIRTATFVDPQSIDAKVFNDIPSGSTFTTAATATLKDAGSVIYKWRCTEDNKMSMGTVPWFRRQQAWTYKDGWAEE